MSPVTIIAGYSNSPVVMKFPRALLEHNSRPFKRLLQAEGMLDESTICLPEFLEPAAVKAGLRILCSRNGGWDLSIRPPRLATPASSAASSLRGTRRKVASCSGSVKSTLTSSSVGSSSTTRTSEEAENSFWWIQLFEVGKYIESEAVQNLAVSGYRKARRSQSCARMWPEIDYITTRQLWDGSLGNFVISLLAFEARSENCVPEWVMQLLEDAPENVFAKVEDRWSLMRSMQERAVIDWEDRVNPCVAMGCLWHTHKETTACVDSVEKQRWIEAIERLVLMPRRGRLEKSRTQ